MVKLLFLDVDGVINRQSTKTKEWYGEWVELESKLIKRLRKIIRETSAEIVLSTSWRTDAKLVRVLSLLFKEKKICSKIVGATVDWKGKATRTHEILAWIALHTRPSSSSSSTSSFNTVKPHQTSEKKKDTLPSLNEAERKNKQEEEEEEEEEMESPTILEKAGAEAIDTQQSTQSEATQMEIEEGCELGYDRWHNMYYGPAREEDKLVLDSFVVLDDMDLTISMKENDPGPDLIRPFFVKTRFCQGIGSSAFHSAIRILNHQTNNQDGKVGEEASIHHRDDNDNEKSSYSSFVPHQWWEQLEACGFPQRLADTFQSK